MTGEDSVMLKASVATPRASITGMTVDGSGPKGSGWRPAGGPAITDAMHELVRRGLSNREINDELLRLGLIDRPYTRQNLSVFRARHGYPTQREPVPDREELIPWVVAERDAGHRYYRCLLLVTRERAGLPLRDKDRDRMDKFVRELFDSGAVIHYDRENGWVAVEPRPGVDNDLIRDPRLDDWGDPIEWDPQA